MRFNRPSDERLAPSGSAGRVGGGTGAEDRGKDRVEESACPNAVGSSVYGANAGSRIRARRSLRDSYHDGDHRHLVTFVYSPQNKGIENMENKMPEDQTDRRVHLVEIKESAYRYFIPYIALTVSVITAAVLIWQGFETRNHYRKIVSPQVVTYTTNTVQETTWGIFLQNEGVGPALIKLHKMTIDGKNKAPVDILDQVIKEDFIKPKHPAVRRVMNEELVLKAGAKTPILAFIAIGVNPKKIDEFERLINKRINLHYRWCSVYNECVEACTALNCKK